MSSTYPVRRPLLASALLPVLLTGASHAPRQNGAAAQMPRVIQQYTQLPLYFEPNLGQTDPRVQFLARLPGYTMFLTAGEAVMVVAGQTERSVLRMKLEGAGQKASATGLERQPGVSAYFIGTDPTKWRPKVPHFGRVQYKDSYPGVDLVYYGSQGQIEYDFLVAPGADAGQIQLAFEGAESLRTNGSGDLLLTTKAGQIEVHKPQVWQQIAGRRVEIAARFLLEGKRAGFKLALYDKKETLVIDPALSLVYSATPHGSGYDQANAIAVDAAGAAYVAGYTNFPDFPTVNAYQSSFSPSGDVEVAFVTKLNPNNGGGSVTLAYSTFLGGKMSTLAFAIAVDAVGAAYVAGWTNSPNLPTVNAYQSSLPGLQNAFVTKLNPFSGSGLVTLAYSTYLGGSSRDFPNGIGVDAAGAAYVAGVTSSVDFPTLHAYQSSLRSQGMGPGTNAFVTKLNANTGSTPVTLAYSTYLGGSTFSSNYLSTQNVANGIAVDAAGAAYVTGSTNASDFPIVNAYQNSLHGPNNAFVTKLNPFSGTGSMTLAYSTYLGGSGDTFNAAGDAGSGIAVDQTGAAYVAGVTSSVDFPTLNAYLATLGSAQNAGFVTKIAPNNGNNPVTLAYSTYLGGTDARAESSAGSIAVDSVGAAYVTGTTNSSHFPILNALQTQYGPIFVTKLNGYRGTGPVTLAYSSYLTPPPPSFSNLGAHPTAIAVDSGGSAYLAGFQTNCCGKIRPVPVLANMFVMKFSPALTSAPTGVLDTPTNNAAVAGAIGVTGWALDPEQFPTVDIWRAPIGSEPTRSNGLVLIGTAVFVAGARPDVAGIYPNYANSDDAGWGLQVLTNTLPDSDGTAGTGNGTYSIHAIAHNGSFSTDLGVKTIRVNNASSSAPFGTIDTPAQGEVVSGPAYVNYGWVVTPAPAIIPTDGSTITVLIDNKPAGHPVYNNFRVDIATLFPGLNNSGTLGQPQSGGAVGYFVIDTTKLANGMHTISWTATDNQGHAIGIGSRFFTVQN